MSGVDLWEDLFVCYHGCAHYLDCPLCGSEFLWRHIEAVDSFFGDRASPKDGVVALRELVRIEDAGFGIEDTGEEIVISGIAGERITLDDWGEFVTLLKLMIRALPFAGCEYWEG